MGKKYKIGYTTGVYDMFHIGHLNILKKAKELCDTLIVGVTTDELCFVRKNKYPIIKEQDRIAIVEAIRYVDRVVFQSDMEKIRPVKEFDVDVVFVGSDWKGSDAWIQYEKEFATVGCVVEYIEYTDGISSSMLRCRINTEIGNVNRKIVGYTTGVYDISPSMPKCRINTEIGDVNRKIVGYTTGVYDMFHIGHLNILKRSKERCGYLIVGVSTDECVESYKHKNPIIPYEERAAIVDAIRFVDEVVPQTSMNKLDFLKKRHFDVMFHGDEWKGTELYNNYEKEFSRYNAHIEYLSHTEGISSSILREKINK